MENAIKFIIPDSPKPYNKGDNYIASSNIKTILFYSSPPPTGLPLCDKGENVTIFYNATQLDREVDSDAFGFHLNMGDIDEGATKNYTCLVQNGVGTLHIVGSIVIPLLENFDNIISGKSFILSFHVVLIYNPKLY